MPYKKGRGVRKFAAGYFRESFVLSQKSLIGKAHDDSRCFAAKIIDRDKHHVRWPLQGEEIFIEQRLQLRVFSVGQNLLRPDHDRFHGLHLHCQAPSATYSIATNARL